MTKPILGIDVSKLDLSLSLFIDKKHYLLKIDNNQEGFKKVQKWLLDRHILSVKACMESTGTYGRNFAQFLYEQNHDVYIVNPLRINAFAKSKLSRHKTDRVDSKIIAEFAYSNDLTLFKPKNKELQSLQDLYRALKKIEHHQMQIDNYLEHKEHLPTAVVDSYKTIQIILIQEQKNIEKAIHRIIEKTGDIKNKVDLMQTIPGIGEKTAIAILAETPDLEFFKTARELAAYAGLTPKHRQSGTSVHGKSSISKIGSSKLRRSLYFPALVAKNHNPLFSSFNENMTKKGKCAKVIITAIMRKLLHIIFGVLKHNKAFDPHFST